MKAETGAATAPLLQLHSLEHAAQPLHEVFHLHFVDHGFANG